MALTWWPNEQTLWYFTLSYLYTVIDVDMAFLSSIETTAGVVNKGQAYMNDNWEQITYMWYVGETWWPRNTPWTYAVFRMK